MWLYQWFPSLVMCGVDFLTKWLWPIYWLENKLDGDLKWASLFLKGIDSHNDETLQFSSVQSLSCVRLLATPWMQHARPPCPSPTPGVYSNSCPSSQWCHPSISSSLVPFSSCRQSLPASGSFPMSQLFTWGGQSIGVSASASVLPMNTQDWSALG